MVTYIANEGFLIETTNHKVLIDALFGNIKGNWCDQPGDSVSRLMTSGIIPFDNINIVLVSHCHSDHFNAPMTIDFLRNNKKSVLICPDQVNERLKLTARCSEVSEQIIAIRSHEHPDTSFIVNGISIRAMRLKHGSWIETDSATGKSVDLHEGVDIISENRGTKNIILMHIEPARREYYKTHVKDIPGFFVFREQMEQKVIIKQDDE